MWMWAPHLGPEGSPVVEVENLSCPIVHQRARRQKKTVREPRISRPECSMPVKGSLQGSPQPAQPINA